MRVMRQARGRVAISVDCGGGAGCGGCNICTLLREVGALL